MSETVMRQHIDLYVNDFSIDLGTQGKKAIIVLNNTYLNSLSSANSYQSQSQSLFL
jgi:1,4-dihydroxy-6-naphthoate synthase